MSLYIAAYAVISCWAHESHLFTSCISAALFSFGRLARIKARKTTKSHLNFFPTIKEETAK